MPLILLFKVSLNMCEPQNDLKSGQGAEMSALHMVFVGNIKGITISVYSTTSSAYSGMSLMHRE